MATLTTATRPAQIEASLQRISQGASTPDDADLWRVVWDALQSVTKTLGIQADVLRSPDEAILMIQYQQISPVPIQVTVPGASDV